MNLGSKPGQPAIRRGGFRSRMESGAMSDINVTNLVDVILVLLIIFMISAPLLQSGIDVNLPKSASTAIDPDETG
ncbi:MAG: biopolymer transporter ExbD, partial [Candidatus Zixiibacteriota bacterium]